MRLEQLLLFISIFNSSWLLYNLVVSLLEIKKKYLSFSHVTYKYQQHLLFVKPIKNDTAEKMVLYAKLWFAFVAFLKSSLT